MLYTIRPFRKSDAITLADLYCACFAEPPWHERFDPTDVAQSFVQTNAADKSVLLIAQTSGILIAGAVGVPLFLRPDIQKVLEQDLNHTFYFSELFVSKRYRRTGVAGELISRRTVQAKVLGFTHAAVRTSVDQQIIQDIYQARGFRIVARQNVTSVKYIDGRILEVPDERVILFGPL